MKRLGLAIIISLMVMLCACGEEKTSQENNQSSNYTYSGSGDVLTDFREAQDHLNDTVARAKAMLNSLDSDGKTSDERAWKAGPGEVQYDDTSTGTANSETSQTTEPRSSSPKNIKATKGTVLLDDGGLKITYQGIEHDNSMNYYSIKVLVENNSNTTLGVQVRDCSVNGFMVVEPFFSPTVYAGMKENASMDFTDNNLSEKANISKVEDIKELTFYFHVYYPDDNNADMIDYDVVTLQF